jgi:hypothetical protein
MPNEIILDGSVETDAKPIKKLISEEKFNGKNLYSATVDLLAGGTRSTPDQLNYLAIYEQAVSVFREASIGLRTAMDTQTMHERIGVLEQILGTTSRPSPLTKTASPSEKDSAGEKTKRELLTEQLTEAATFSNSYALYFAGEVGLALLDSQKQEAVKDRFFFGTKNQSLENKDVLSGMLAYTTTQHLIDELGKKKAAGEEIDDSALKGSLEKTFTSWVNQFKWASFADVAQAQGINELNLKYGNFSMRGGEFSKKFDTVTVRGSFMKATVEDLIGQEKDRETMVQNVYRLLSWDEKTKTNIFAPPTGIIVFGGPGCGKTMSGHAYVNLAIRESKRLKLPLLAIQLSIGAFGSTYQNEPALKLAAIRDEIKNFPGAVIMQASDVDTFLPQKRAKEPSQEENKVSGVCFSLFDNSVIPAGKFMALMDANYLDNIDPALMSRFGGRIELKRFARPEDFAKYARIYLTKDSDGVGINTDAEWLSLGQYLLESNLSNREIANVITDLKGSFKITPEIVLGSDKDKLAFRNDYLKTITSDVVLSRFQDFVESTMTIERKSREAKLRDQREKYESLLGKGELRTGEKVGEK